jgi:hypothetical protein
MSTPVTPAPRLLQLAVQGVLLLALMVPYGCSDPRFHPADRVDQDGDGFYAKQDLADSSLSVQQLQDLKLDCDDDNDDIFPNAAELCDGEDNDCDGVQESDETDDDGDGFSECGYSELAANVGKEDCDDADPEIYPEAVDLCDGKDNDCDGRDLLGGLWPGVEADRDGDLFVGCNDCSDDPTVDSQAADTNSGIDPPECSDYLREIAAPGETPLGTDCQPYTGAQTLWWPDLDGDGDADAAATESNGMVQETCGPNDTDFAASDYLRVDPGDPDGEPEYHDDCDDSSALLNSYDLDGDDFSTCTGDLKFGGVQSADGDEFTYPGASERCDGEDNDLDGETDEDFDSDNDGAPANTQDCSDAYQGQPLDCNDTDPSLNQSDLDNDGFSTCGADSIEASGDEDCNDGNSLLNLTDIDGDGATTCDLPADCDDFNASLNLSDIDGDGFSSCTGDCDDGDPSRYPGAPAVCDSSADNDCNGVDDPNEADLDNDGDSICDGDCNDQDASLDAADGDGDGFSSCTGDCDDSSNQVYPGAPIVCDSVPDNDCNGVVDLNEADQDSDGDSLCDGDCNDFDASLNLSDGDLDSFSSCTGDCDDNNSLVNSTVDNDGDGWDVCGDTLNPSDGVPADCDDTDPSLNWNDVDGDGASTCSSPPDCDDFDPALNQVDQDSDGVTTCGNDCDDNNSNVRPTFTVESNSRDGLDNDCDGTTDEHATWLGGYIVVVEMMISADASNSDGLGEYLELYNPYNVPVDLRGWEVQVQNSATGLPDFYTFPSGVGVDPIIVPANTAGSNLRMVLARANNDLVYGFDVTNQSGVAGYVWEAALFGNTGGTVGFRFPAASGTPLVDQVSWGPSAAGGWLQGRSMSMPGTIDNNTHNQNNSASSTWCTEVPTIGGNNQGTPGDPAGCT